MEPFSRQCNVLTKIDRSHWLKNQHEVIVPAVFCIEPVPSVTALRLGNEADNHQRQWHVVFGNDFGLLMWAIQGASIRLHESISR